MNKQIQPVSTPTTYTCGNCGSQINIVSTTQASANLDICSNCHPAYTGKETKQASGSKVDSFNNRYKLKS